MNRKEIDELKRLAAKATPGPWVANQDGDGSLCETRRPDGEHYIVIEPAEWDDAEYIAAVNPQVILGLLASYEHLEKEAEWLACKLEERDPGCKYCEEYNKECIPSLQARGYKGPDNWREAARKALEESNDNS